MVNNVTKRFAVEGCSTQASFGAPGGRPTHCGKHADRGVASIVCSDWDPSVYGTLTFES